MLICYSFNCQNNFCKKLVCKLRYKHSYNFSLLAFQTTGCRTLYIIQFLCSLFYTTPHVFTDITVFRAI